jgi:hypothetical protein
VKQNYFLCHVAKPAAPGVEIDLVKRVTVDQYPSAIGPVKADQQITDCRLARAGSAGY